MPYTISWQYPGDVRRHATAEDGSAASQLASALRLSGAILVSVESTGTPRHAKPRVDEPLYGAEAARVRAALHTWPGTADGVDVNQP